MLSDDMISIEDEHGHDNDADEVSGAIQTPDPVREGILDVLSLKAIVRAVATLRGNNKRKRDADFDRALSRMINLNGSIARAIEHDRGR